MFTLKKIVRPLLSVFIALPILISCGNRITLKSVGRIDIDSMMVKVEPQVVLSMYRNDLLPEKYEEVYSVVAREKASEANLFNSLMGGAFSIDQSTYEMMVSEEIDDSYLLAWENIQHIALNDISLEDFHIGDIDDEYASEFILYYYETVAGVRSRIIFDEPVLIKDEKGYATFKVRNTFTDTEYLITLTPENETEYNIEVSEI